MKVGDLITDADLDEAPEPFDEAFAYCAEVAGDRLEKLCAPDPNDEEDWRYITDARYQYMNVLIGLSKPWGITDISVWCLPSRGDFDDNAFTSFKADVDHFVTQLMVTRAQRRRQDSVILYTSLREDIRAKFHGLKTAVDKSGFHDSRKASLHAKLREFEGLLDKGRLNMVAVARVVMEIMSLSANAAALSDSATIHRLLGGIQTNVAEHKEKQDAERALQAPPPKMITPPAPKANARSLAEQKSGFGTGRERFPVELDDEIPF